ncbi:MAG TPA: wax ester/triacylglycerol synthase family O-acyltransferase [Ramlibacter sp.]|nr:wax ester/triacylglycerol synthase family O-acyltransferase [Ramlibacter sp.]
MKTLSGLDATFLYLETAETPMHVGSLHLYELPKGAKGSFTKAVREHIGRRMHLAPIFSRRLAFMPFDLGHPVWVEADAVDLEFHIRKAPGGALTVRQVEAAAAKLHSRLIDREHPLWEFHIFENVKPAAGSAFEGKLVAFYSKIHHAALDGKGGTVLANAILDLTEQPREVPPPDPAHKRRAAGDLKIGDMIGAVFSNSLAQYAKIARSLPAAVTSVGGAVAGQAKSAVTNVKSPVGLAPRTLFNSGITKDRVFATAAVPFAECRVMAKAVGGSFNDVVLWLCSTALRDYLAKHDHIPKKPLVAAMPVSLREESNKELNNQASIALAELGTNHADPMKRMNAIMESTAKVKAALANLKQVLPTDYPSLMAPWLVGGAGKALFRTYGKSGIAEKLPALANLAISNVPGPQVPLYLAGARMRTFHPISIIMHGMALNITVQTYAGSVDFGIVGCPRAVPHVHDLAAAIEHAFAQAQSLFKPAVEKKNAHTPLQRRPARPRARPAGARISRAA